MSNLLQFVNQFISSIQTESGSRYSGFLITNKGLRESEDSDYFMCHCSNKVISFVEYRSDKKINYQLSLKTGVLAIDNIPKNKLFNEAFLRKLDDALKALENQKAELFYKKEFSLEVA